jgi:hypothetical protein
VNGGMDGEKALGRARRFEPLLLSLASSYRQMGILRPVVRAQAAIMLRGEPNRAERRPVRLQAIIHHPGRRCPASAPKGSRKSWYSGPLCLNWLYLANDVAVSLSGCRPSRSPLGKRAQESAVASERPPPENQARAGEELPGAAAAGAVATRACRALHRQRRLLYVRSFGQIACSTRTT